METINDWTNILLDSLREMSLDIAAVIPNILGAILILIFGWLVTKFLVFLTKRFLKFTKVDNLMDNLKQKEAFGSMKWDFKISKIIITTLKFMMFLVFLTVALEVLNWDVISKEIGGLLSYIPKLLIAVVLFMVGIYIAGFVRKIVKVFFSSFELTGSKIIGNIVYYFIVVIVTVMALNQAQIDTTIITNNLTLVLGAFLLTISIGLGLGSRTTIQKIIASFYSNKQYEIGETLVVDNVEGKIISFNNISVTIKTAKGRMVIPINEIIESRIEILD